ncbi:ATP-binding protein [Candidatus Dependentiae bacterium]|nr:ATP-binding protein [Candidatus Dependentiae bacterium]
MSYIKEIMAFSPWWRNKYWYEDDLHIRMAEESGLKLRYLENEYEAHYPRVDIIRGPRQIGKTTEIKFLVRDLISSGTPSNSIGYFTGDIIYSKKELFLLLRSFSEHLEINDLKDGTFFIDEISSIKDWYKGIKSFIDLGFCQNIHLILTGSSSIELKLGFDRMPGRRFNGKNYLFLPQTFKGFCKLTHPDHENPEFILSEIITSEKKFKLFQEHVLMDFTYYKSLFQAYLNVGGFPRPISDFFYKNKVQDETLLIFQSILFSEFEKHGRSLTTLLNLLKEITNSLTSPISYNTLMKKIGLSNAKSVKEYLELLNYSFLGIQAFSYDVSKKRSFSNRNKKIYLIDPIIFRLLHQKLGMKIPDESKIVENITAMEISRLYKQNWADIGLLSELYYWKSKRKGNEIDFLIQLNEKPFGLEVKYQNTISGWDELSIKKGIGKGLILTKDFFEYGEICKIPVSAFLLLSIK